jgi:signal peptidase I
MKTFLGYAASVVLIFLFIVLVLLAYGTLNNRWYKVLAIDGNSMSPTLLFGDLVVITPPTEIIPAGTVVTMNVNGSLVTHRLLADYHGGRPETKGDANGVADNFSGSNLRVVGIVRFYIPLLGYPFFYIRSLFGKT